MDNKLENYKLFPNSNDIVRHDAFGVVYAIEILLIKLNEENLKVKPADPNRPILEEKIPISEYGKDKYEIGLYRAADTKIRAVYEDIAARFCKNPALYKKVLACFFAWCTKNDTWSIDCDIEDIIEEGYRKSEGGRRFAYHTKVEFCQVVHDLLNLEFYAIQKTGGGGRFKLLSSVYGSGKETFEGSTIRTKNPIFKKINFECCAGLANKLFTHDAIYFPKKSLYMSTKNRTTYELAHYIHWILYIEANKGNDGKMFTVSSLAKYVGKTNSHKRLIEKLNTIIPYFLIDYKEQPGGSSIYIRSNFLLIKSPSKRKKVPPKNKK